MNDSFKNRRKLWLKVHLWLGLGLGLFISLFGITGSILVFHQEINELLNPAMLTVAQPSETAVYQPLESIYLAGKQAMPNSAKLAFSDYPRNAEAAFKLNFNQPTANEQSESWQVYVNPYTAQVTGKQLMSRSDNIIPNTLIGLIFELHYALLLGESPGYLIVSAMAALLIISVLTGLIVWYPLTGQWLKAFSLKRKASKARFVFDLHKTSGIYSTLILIPVLFSGIYMDTPEYVVPVIELFSPVTYRYWFQSAPQQTTPLTMAEAVAIANQRYPTGRPDWIYGISTPTSTYTVCKNHLQEQGGFLHRCCVVIDQYRGKILDVDDSSIGTAGEVFTHWQWSLHSGQAFGWTGRILVFLSGLACPVLFVTGVIRWLQKRKAYQTKHFASSQIE
jgi:uncharacterized iron-regulated membrane protein